MAENILKLKVDSQEYNGKIKRASQSIQQLAESMRNAGKSFGDIDKESVAFVQALGKMGTVATSAKGQLREMTQSLTDLTVIYRGMTDQEKATPFGQELAKSIEQLKERAGEVRDAMDDVNKSIQNAASDTRAFDQIAQGAQVATSGFQAFQGAAKLLGVQMGDNVEIIAKLQAAMAVTNGLMTIQTALQEQSALMQGVNAAKTALAAAAQKAFAAATGNATAAQAAFNTVSKMNPYALLATAIGAAVVALSAFTSGTNEAEEAQRQFADVLENTQKALKDIEASANFDIAIANATGKATRDLLVLKMTAASTAEELAFNNIHKAALLGDEESMKQAQAAWRQAMDKATAARDELEAYDTSTRQIQKGWSTLGTEKEINAAISRFKELREEAQLGSQQWKEYNDRITQLQAKLPNTTGGRTGSGGTGKSRGKKDTTPKVTAINTESQTELQLLQGQLQNAIALRDTYGKASQDWKDMNASAEELQRQIDEMNGVKPDGPLVQMEKVAQELQELMKNPASAEEYRALAEDLKAVNKEIADFKGEGKDPTGKKNSVSQTMGGLANGMNQVVGGIQQLGIDIPKGISDAIGAIQTVATILTGISSIVTIIAAIQGTKAVPVIGWALAHGGVVHAANGFVGGNYYSGDQVPAMLDSGEMVLNKFQQYALAANLQAGGGNNGYVPSHISGEQIFIALNRYMRRTGKGEIVNWKN